MSVAFAVRDNRESLRLLLENIQAQYPYAHWFDTVGTIMGLVDQTSRRWYVALIVRDGEITKVSCGAFPERWDGSFRNPIVCDSVREYCERLGQSAPVRPTGPQLGRVMQPLPLP